jgi:hypothetical protein
MAECSNDFCVHLIEAFCCSIDLILLKKVPSMSVGNMQFQTLAAPKDSL